MSRVKKYIGKFHDRIKFNHVEKAFADEWEKVNIPERMINNGFGILEAIVFSEGKDRELTKEEVVTASTIIQWLGSNIGFCFLQDALARCDYQIVHKKGITVIETEEIKKFFKELETSGRIKHETYKDSPKLCKWSCWLCAFKRRFQ